MANNFKTSSTDFDSIFLPASATWQLGERTTLWGTGHNGYGQLGMGDLVHRSTPTQIGTLGVWGTVSTGQRHTTAIQNDGSIWSWGHNGYGQLGLNDKVHRSSPIQIGAAVNWRSVSGGMQSTLAIKTDGSLWGWGQGSYSQNPAGSSPIQIGSLTNWSLVSCGNGCALAVKTDGTLWSWGYSSTGQHGIGVASASFSSPAQVGTLTNWSSVSAGQSHVLATKTDGTLWAWGQGSYGALGRNDNMSVSSPIQVGSGTNWVSCSASFLSFHSTAVKNDGTLWSWGYNSQGQLGLGDTVHRSSPTQVGTLTNWNLIEAGYYCVVGVKTDGTLWSWGNTSYGVLGHSTYSSSPIQVGSSQNWKSCSSSWYFSTFILNI